MPQKIVTIDGLAGVGKTSVASTVAKMLGFRLLYSGLIYRAFAKLISEKLKITDIRTLSEQLVCKEVSKLAEEHRIYLIAAGQGEVSKRSLDDFSQLASLLSSFKCVREALLPIQRIIYTKESFVAEGRDMGSVVFPEADLKFYVETAPTVRANRRLKDSLTTGACSKSDLFLKILMDIVERDVRDINRRIAPCIKTADMIVILNHHDPLQTCHQVVFHVKSHLNLV